MCYDVICCDGTSWCEVMRCGKVRCVRWCGVMWPRIVLWCVVTSGYEVMWYGVINFVVGGGDGVLLCDVTSGVRWCGIDMTSLCEVDRVV